MSLYRPKPRKGYTSPFYYYDFTVNGTRYTGGTGKKSKPEAREVEAEKRKQAKSGRCEQSIQAITFGALADDYLRLHAESETKSAGFYGSMLSPMREHFGERLLAGISRRDCEEFMAARRLNVKPSSANASLTVLKQAFKWAEEHDYLAEGANPAGRLKAVKVQARDRYLTPEQAQKLMDSCTEWLRPIVLTYLHTGCRKEEGRRLTWGDIDFGAQQVIFRLTKNGGTRRVPMSKPLADTLKALPNRLKGGPVFLRGREPVTRHVLRVGFLAARDKAGFDWLHIHDLRHSWATACGAAGMHPRTLQTYGGWSQLAMVMRYCAVAKESETHARGLLDGIFKDTPATVPQQDAVTC